VGLVGRDQHRQEGADAEIDAAPADIEGALPLLSRVGEQAAAAADAGVVEQKVDPVGLLLLGELVAESLEMILDRDVGDMGRDALALRQLFELAQLLGLGHRGFRDVAHRDIAALGDELPRELASHSRAAAGDDGDLSCKILHGTFGPSLVGMFLHGYATHRSARKM
jgi:hypothetical protein